MATPSPSSYPALLSAPRLTTLLASTLVSFASGSGYTYSAWAPQLGARLGLSHTQLNVISVAGNVGSHTTGFIWGKIVDSCGPRILLAGGAVSILSGYLGIWNFFVAGLSPTETSLPSFRFLALSACNYAIGVATIAGHMSSTNATAKTFPDRARATALGVVISALGLAAFVFSTVAQMLFPGDTSSLLLLLTFGTTLPMILGFFWVRPIPLPPSSNPDAVDRHDAVVFRYENASQTHLLVEGSTDPNESDRAVYEGGDVLELSSRRPCDSMGSGKEYHVEQPNIYGLRLCKTPEFWLLSAMFAMLSGTGLMYINNVGVMSQALYVHSRSVYDDKDAQKWQAVQVSIISVTSFAGRITIGLLNL